MVGRAIIEMLSSASALVWNSTISILVTLCCNRNIWERYFSVKTKKLEIKTKHQKQFICLLTSSLVCREGGDPGISAHRVCLTLAFLDYK